MGWSNVGNDKKRIGNSLNRNKKEAQILEEGRNQSQATKYLLGLGRCKMIPTRGILQRRVLSSLLSSRSPNPRPHPPRGVVSGVAADMTDIVEDEEEYKKSLASPTTLAAPDVLQPRVVIYDGVCHLCHGGVKWVINADKYRKIKFCCLQSKAAEPYMKLCGVDREDVSRRFLFIEGLGLYHQGSTAALKVVSYLPPPYSALSALMIIPTPLREAVYDYVAKRRYDIFGKGKSCLVLQERELLERFVDREELVNQSQSEF